MVQELREVTLRGKHVQLEPLRDTHVSDLWPAASEREIWRYMPVGVESADDLATWILRRLEGRRAGTGLPFLQRDVKTGAAFGSTSLFEIDLEFKRAEIGHTWIGKDHRRTAANTEAKLLLMTHAFETMGLARIQFKCDARNLQSEQAILRLGATKEGVLRSFMVLRDGFKRDTAIFSILEEEWPATKARLEGLLADAPAADGNLRHATKKSPPRL